MLIYIYTSVVLSIAGMTVFALNRKHLLIMLLSLEFIIISLYMNMYIYFSMMNYEYFFIMIFLTMSVCESSLGLALLVSMIRSYGNDHVMTFCSLW